MEQYARNPSSQSSNRAKCWQHIERFEKVKMFAQRDATVIHHGFLHFAMNLFRCGLDAQVTTSAQRSKQRAQWRAAWTASNRGQRRLNQSIGKLCNIEVTSLRLTQIKMSQKGSRPHHLMHLNRGQRSNHQPRHRSRCQAIQGRTGPSAAHLRVARRSGRRQS